MGGTTREALEELRFKYREMLAMRLAHSAGTDTAERARARMVFLAERFPGALREVDELELLVIQDRIRRLDAVVGGALEVEPWMEAIGLFHALARGALRAKRWLAGRKDVDASMEHDYEAAVARSTEALAWAKELRGIASPPGGRIVNLVFARVAGTLGITEAEARSLVFAAKSVARRRAG